MDQFTEATGEVSIGTPRKSAQIGQLADALAKAQKAMTAATKDRTAKVTSQKGTYSYRYADLATCLDVIRQPLADNGLALLQPAGCDGDLVTVTTILAHKSGEWIEQPLSMRPTQPTAQGVGSAITYARRYGLAMVGAVTEEDDDGTAASQPAPRQTQRPASSLEARRAAGAAPAAPPAPEDEDDFPYDLPGAPTPHPWGDGPTDVAPPEQRATDKQIGKIKAEWKARKLPVDREAYLAELSRRAGRTVASSTDLTMSEASRVIDSFAAPGQGEMLPGRQGA